MPTTTKRDIVIEVSKRTGLTQNKVMNVLQSSIDAISEHLSEGDDVVLRNFGTFYVKKIKPKVGRNPIKPEIVIQIPERTVVKFKTGKSLKNNVAKLLKKK